MRRGQSSLYIIRAGVLKGKQGVQRGISQFFLADKDDIIIPAGTESRYIKLLIEQGLSEDIWRQLVDTNPDLATKYLLQRFK